MPKSALANGPSKKRQIKGKTEEEYSTGKKKTKENAKLGRAIG